MAEKAKKVKYVTPMGKKFMSTISIMNKPDNPNGHGSNISCGSYDTAEEAYRAAIAAKEAIADAKTYEEQRDIVVQLKNQSKKLNSALTIEKCGEKEFAEFIALAVKRALSSGKDRKAFVSTIMDSINEWKVGVRKTAKVYAEVTLTHDIQVVVSGDSLEQIQDWANVTTPEQAIKAADVYREGYNEMVVPIMGNVETSIEL